MATTRLRVSGACVAGLLAVGGLALVAPPAAAAQAGSLAVSPSEPMGNEQVRLDGALPPRSRPVVLQRRSTDGSWAALSSATSRADGSFTFTVTAPPQVGRTVVYRVAAPRVRLGGTTHPAVETPPQQITTVRQSGALDVPASAAPGEVFEATATFLPAREGRPVVLQKRIGTQWSRVSAGAQAADGTATFSVTAEPSGTTTYRARTLRFRNAAAIGTPLQTVTTTLDEDTTAPPIPGPVAAEPGDGMVGLSWPDVTADDLAGYHVFAADLPEGPWTRLTTTPLATASYDATGLDHGRRYVFAVSSVDATGNESERSEPVTATTFLPVEAGVSAGHQHTCRVDAAGSASCWGNNTDGQLGDGTNQRRPVQTLVSGARGWVSIIAGRQNTCGVQRDGSLWCWGDNQLGQLGNGTTSSTTDRRDPGQVGTDTDWRSVTLGRYHVCATKADDTAWCWGWGGRGQLGLGEPTTQLVPAQLQGQWSRLAAGDDHTCGLQSDGSLWCWGAGRSGQLGVGDQDLGPESRLTAPSRVGTDRWSDLAAGYEQSCAIREDGTLWCWGSGSAGQLGNGTTDVKVTSPRQVGSADDWASISTAAGKTCGLRTDSGGWCWGIGAFPDLALSPVPVPTLRFADLDAGGTHVCGTTLGAQTLCWGHNGEGQLGNGRSDRELAPVRVGEGSDWSDAEPCGLGKQLQHVRAQDRCLRVVLGHGLLRRTGQRQLGPPGRARPGLVDGAVGGADLRRAARVRSDDRRRDLVLGRERQPAARGRDHDRPVHPGPGRHRHRLDIGQRR